MARRRPTEPTVNPARGAALVVVAVLLGLVLLRNGIDTSEVVTSTRDDSKEADDGGTDEGTDEGAEETTTTLAVRPPAEVTVIVLNGTSTSGVAGTYSTAIGSATALAECTAADSPASSSPSCLMRRSRNTGN